MDGCFHEQRPFLVGGQQRCLKLGRLVQSGLGNVASFDWIRFLESHNIDYSDRGVNVSRGNIATHCPWCGDDDTGQHMGISLNGRGYGCWRVKAHRGTASYRLVQALIGCSKEDAEAIVASDSTGLPIETEFSAKVRQAWGAGTVSAPKPKHLEFLPEFRPIQRDYASLPFFDYLEGRGYRPSEVVELSELYGLQRTIKGKFRYRVVIPVYGVKCLETWTGRTIVPDTEPRYRALSADVEKAKADGLPPALKSIDKALWNYGELLRDGGDTLVLCEGPFDAINVDFYGRPRVRATCMFSKNLSVDQLELLDALARRFRHKVLVLDADAGMDLLRMLGRLEHMGFRGVRLPAGFKDPGELGEGDVWKLFGMA